MKSKVKIYIFAIILFLITYSTIYSGIQESGNVWNMEKNKTYIYPLNLQNIEYKLNYSSYFGGNDWDFGLDIYVDDLGYMYLLGDTKSAVFPIVGVNADPTFNGGNNDVFISKFAPNGTLVFSTYFGGGGADAPRGIFVDPSGNMYIVGDTTSTNLPIEGVNANSTFGGGNEGFVAIFSSNGTLLYSTYLGGRYTEYARAIHVDQVGNFYVGGSTSSPDFPIVGIYANSTYKGTDGFVTKFDTDGQIVYSTYFGGNETDRVNGIEVDLSYNIYISGETESLDFPISGVNSNSTFGGGFSDAYVSKFASDGMLIYSTYLGGSDSDSANNVGIDPLGNIYAAGDTYSTNFPITGAYANSTFGGGILDGFVSIISSGGELNLLF
jgi:hypothetical protein